MQLYYLWCVCTCCPQNMSIEVFTVSNLHVADISSFTHVPVFYYSVIHSIVFKFIIIIMNKIL